jgi:hypothetical protein
MAKFLLWSDLHREVWNFDPPQASDIGFKPDALLLAGDTDHVLKNLTFASEMSDRFDCPVVMVNGNHEYYMGYYHECREAEAEELRALHKKGIPVHVLHGDAIEIAGTRILGATFWTDFNLDPSKIFDSRLLAEQLMNDYRVIGLSRENPRRLRAADTIGFHLDEKAKLWKHLETPFAGPTLVMTHHLPVKQGIHGKYQGSNLNPAFASDLAHEIMGFDFDAWVSGHTHDGFDFEMEAQDGTARRFVSNPRGYPQEAGNFDPYCLIETR